MDGTYLELLLADAPAVDYETPVLRARARGDPPARVAELERAKVLALRLRAALERHRRRESELAGLFQTASDLAGLRDLDAVLRAIVGRARRLLATDVAYLTLEDPDRGDTYMRVTDGTVAATFHRVRLPMGAGLGGLVAQTSAPYATERYATDARFRHTTDIDDAVGDEGLVAILGVPLRLGGQVIGVLFAADRRQRRYTAEQVALLGSLADHAAVAIDSARMLQETRAALADLDAASRLLRSRAEATERAATAHDRLTNLVLRGASLTDLAGAVTELLGGSLRILDEEGHPLAETGTRPAAPDLSTPDKSRPDPPAPELADAIATSRRTGRAIRCGPNWVAAAIAGHQHLGALVLVPAVELDDADRRILERSALVTALLLLFGRSAADTQAKLGGDLLADLLLASDRDPAGLRERARRLGIDLDAPHIVLCLTRTNHTWRARLAAARAGLTTRHDGREALLLPGTDPSAVARAVVAELRHQVTAGAAGPVSGPAAIAGAYRDAACCLDTALALGRHGDGVSLADLGFLGLVLGEHRDLDAFIRATIGPLLDYDRRRGSHLVETLVAYFAADRSPSRAREALHVHTNTVHQRLERVTRLLGPDWSGPAASLEIQLALRLQLARRTAGRSAGGTAG